MAQDVLVSGYPGSRRYPLVEQGGALLSLLDKRGFPVTAAFWFRDAESQTWAYYLASPRVATEGPLSVYKTLQEYVGRVGLTLQDLAVVSPHDRAVDLVRAAVRPPATHDPSNLIFKDRFPTPTNAVHEVALDDAYIYRLA